MSFAARMTRSPEPYDAELGQSTAARFADQPAELRGLIAGTAGCSPYLKGLIERNADWLEAALDSGPEAAFEAVLAGLDEVAPEAMEQGLRQAKARSALLIALADLAGIWSLEQCTGALSRLADHCVARALETTVAAEIRKRALPETDRPAGGAVALAMGKMGAGELNYSSDIDLIMLFDGDLYRDSYEEARAALVRATRRMARMLSAITQDGYVFRTDLRLRPDAAVTPVCLSMDAAEAYYESVGRTWERAAYIKARAAAGDVAGGETFLKRLTPFIWRKHLDFAAIQDAHDMRLKIRAHKGLFGPIKLPGHDMKLGRGGIREIEFFTQTRQLIAGGRDPALRVRGTVAGLAVLAERGWIDAGLSTQLTAAYRAHREVEHRLQMTADAQTHALPGDAKGFDRLAAFMGEGADTLRRDLVERLEMVHAQTEGFFAPGQPGPQGQGAATDVPDAAQSVVERWYSYPALRSARAVEIFERLKPDLLARLTHGGGSDALEHFDLFLAGLPAGVQVFSLFEANPQLIDLIADIVTTAPALARYLGRNAQVFDAVIGGDFFAPWPGVSGLLEDLVARLQDGDYERQLDAARRWHKEWHFRVGVHHLRGVADARQTGQHYAELAQAVLRALWPVVVAEFARKHGSPPGAGAVVLGMGSLGAAQLAATSDLDLIVIYDAAGVEASDGPRSLAARAYYARLTQAFVTALSAQTAEGALYEVDMRLRPSGRQGPVATAVTAFESYQRDEAWTWEHLALTRARAVAGSEALGARVEAFRRGLLAAPRKPAKICADVAEMRGRLAEATGASGAWEVKRGAGRLQDIELLGQAAALLAGDPARTTAQQLALLERLGWASPAEVAELRASHGWLWALQAAGRLLTGDAPDLDALGDQGRGFVLAQAAWEDAPALQGEIARVADRLAALVTRSLEHPPKAG
ncbi:bifunctional [glutamine synthetase] adenylyltransferase/[glutamine synthetase]-adenylyl-L-tyrosine phosphorylase [Candidatus Rhodobacter oscarellae]|nr:bifunctional [glutamine synthetase] adenylyltransferase/[glutamine synthetase]-adenylyl-L-tyrosine phosphorylase [Candidatus Rhodobacter lobularis]